MPKISVVMPCYNEEANIEKSIRCILNQTFGDFELLVVDDCSTDGSAEVIRSIQDKRIRYLKNDVNSGVAKTLNHGLKEATGELIARMDADDSCSPERFAKQVEYMDKYKNCVVCGTLGTVSDGKITMGQGSQATDLKKHLCRNNPFIHTSVMFRRVIDGKPVRYPEVKGFEDYALWIELSDKGDFHNIPEQLVHRVDARNLETKKTWEGFNRRRIYKRLLTFQYRATKKTKHFAYGFRNMALTAVKLGIATICRK